MRQFKYHFLRDEKPRFGRVEAMTTSEARARIKTKHGERLPKRKVRGGLRLEKVEA